MASYSVDLCTVATAIPLSDEKVITKLTEKILEGNVYNCHGCLSTFELIYVYFDFDCPPGVLCFVKPLFAAVVNLITRKVVDIVDPFTFSKCDTLKKKIRNTDQFNRTY